MNDASITEAEILARVVCTRVSDFSPEAARSLLKLRFDCATTREIRHLLRKNNRGSISVTEKIILERYLRVGQLIDLLHARARLSLHQVGGP